MVIMLLPVWLLIYISCVVKKCFASSDRSSVSNSIFSPIRPIISSVCIGLLIISGSGERWPTSSVGLVSSCITGS